MIRLSERTLTEKVEVELSRKEIHSLQALQEGAGSS